MFESFEAIGFGYNANQWITDQPKQDRQLNQPPQVLSNEFMHEYFELDDREDGRGIKILYIRKRLPINIDIVFPSTVDDKQLYLPNDSSSLFINEKIHSVDFSNLKDTSNVTQMYAMFCNCVNLEGEDPVVWGNFDTSNVTNMNFMFEGCSSITSLDLSTIDTSKVKSMRLMFNRCEKLEKLNVSKLNTSNVEDMSGMFVGCRNLQELDLSNFDTSSAVFMSIMFSGCKNLHTVNLSSFDTSNVYRLDGMFKNCRSLESLDLYNFNTVNVDHMEEMFFGCESLKYITFSKYFTTDKVFDMYGMFKDCRSLTELDILGFDSLHLYACVKMFANCINLKRLYLGKFKLHKNTDTREMFCMCDKLKYIQSDIGTIPVENTK